MVWQVSSEVAPVQLRANSTMAVSGVLSGVVRRNTEGGSGSAVPVMMPCVSSVSTSPETCSDRRRIGLSA